MISCLVKIVSKTVKEKEKKMKIFTTVLCSLIICFFMSNSAQADRESSYHIEFNHPVEEDADFPCTYKIGVLFTNDENNPAPLGDMTIIGPESEGNFTLVRGAEHNPPIASDWAMDVDITIPNIKFMFARIVAYRGELSEESITPNAIQFPLVANDLRVE